MTLAVGKSGGGSARDNRSVLFLFPQVRIAQAVGLRRGKIRLPEEGGGDQTASVVRRAQGSRLSKKKHFGSSSSRPPSSFSRNTVFHITFHSAGSSAVDMNKPNAPVTIRFSFDDAPRLRLRSRDHTEQQITQQGQHLNARELLACTNSK